MSPVKKASAVTGLRRAVGATQTEAEREQEAAAIIEGTTPEQQAVREALRAPANPYLEADRRNARPPKPVRVTLDLSPADYAALNQWLGSAAAEVGAPVSKAQALRAMIKAVSLDKSIGLVVTDLLRRDRPA